MTIHRRPLISLAAAIIVFSAPALAAEPPTPELPTAELPTAEPPAQVQTAVGLATSDVGVKKPAQVQTALGLTPDVGVKKFARRKPVKVSVLSSRQIGRYPTHRVHEGFLVLGVGF
jgi:hypothetical protein